MDLTGLRRRINFSFKEAQKKVRPAVEAMLTDAEKAAEGKSD
jgi:hypothetical protein